MSVVIDKNYKTYEIVVREDGKFEARDSSRNTVFWSETLSDLKKKIDKAHKLIVKQIGYCYERWDNKKIRQVTVTSVSEDRHYSGKDYELWVKYTDDGRRQKISLGNVFKDTPDNKEAFKEMQKFEEEIEKLENQRSELRKNLKPITLEDLGYSVKKVK